MESVIFNRTLLDEKNGLRDEDVFSSVPPTRYDNVHIIFGEVETLNAVLESTSAVLPEGLDRGLVEFVESHKGLLKNPTDLQEEIDVAMAVFEEKEREDAARRKRKIVDDDGFELVQKKSRVVHVKAAETAESKDGDKKSKKDKKKPFFKLDFYKFQQKAAKRAGESGGFHSSCCSFFFF